VSRPRLNGVLETALYSENKPRLVRFFREVMGLETLRDEERLTAFDAGGASVILVFAAGASVNGEDTPMGHIPGHDGSGPLHLAFKVSEEDYPVWQERLRAADAPDLGEIEWPAGGRSWYFKDPDGHVLEIATPGLWGNY